MLPPQLMPLFYATRDRTEHLWQQRIKVKTRMPCSQAHLPGFLISAYVQFPDLGP